MKLKQSLLVLSLVVLGLLFAACGGGTVDTMVRLTVDKAGDGNGTVTSAPEGINLGTGDTTGSAQFDSGTTVTLTATRADGSTFAGFEGCTAGTGAEANSCVVTLNADTTVTATFNEEDDGGNGGTPTVTSVTIDSEDFELGVDQEKDLEVDVEVTGGAADTVTWESSDPNIASVDANTGVVTGVTAGGPVTITATSTVDATKQDTVMVTVTAEAQVVVDIDQDDFTLNVNETQQLSATVTGNADTGVTWESSDPNIASVDANGLVTANTVGPATITATSTADPSKSDTVQVTVSSGTTTPGSGSFDVIEGTDDAEQFLEFSNTSFPPNSVFTTSDDLDITNDINPSSGSRGNQLIGIRFQNVTIPSGATITSAYIQFTAINKPTPGAGTPSFTIRGEASDNAQPFVEKEVNGISSRPTTTAEVAWAPAAWQGNRATEASRSADITSVVQEIVNRQGWAASNALAVVISGPNSATDYRAAKSFEADTTGNGAGAPVLVVEYTTPAP